MVQEPELAAHGEKGGGPLGEVGRLQFEGHGHMRLDGDGGVGADESTRHQVARRGAGGGGGRWTTRST